MDNNQKPTPITFSLNDLLVAKNLRVKAVDCLERCLSATHSFYDVITGKIITVPDYKTILVAVQTTLAYTDGRPVERREIITRHATTLEELKAKAKSSPELRAAIQELLA